ncbi:MAG: methyltransferase [Parabacteroides sp.]|nr:methyltransferase [Parabacteroides sp.]
MANPYFQFKSFTVWHDKCAMKVGTDGVLLGAWAKTESCQRILDVGTGTGLIALMLAQRGTAILDAIDIDSDACSQARENIAKSPFANRIQVYRTPLSEYTPDEGINYDLIVSNPPYFIDSLKCPDTKRSLARHTDTLPLPDLLRDSRKLLAPEGNIALILPFEQRESLIDLAREESLFPSRETHVSPVPDASPKRLLIELSAKPVAEPELSYLTLEIERHRYTDEFTALAKDFYLKM